MPSPVYFTRPSVRRATLATLAVLTASSLTMFAPPRAVSAPDTDCPEAAPLYSVDRGDAVGGRTVTQGTTPTPFTGAVVGTLKDGIAPGLDMVMVELTSTEIDRVGGIWAGMSGSPVYDDQDRLIGAVSYGLAGTTPVAGVTPARAMYRLLDAAPPGSATRHAQRADVPRRLADRLVRRGEVTRAEVSGGLQRLPMPVSVSGLRTERLGKLSKRLDLGDTRYYRAGSTAGAGAGDAADIVPGGNLAATMSYGDLTAGGVGTTTAVCGDEVLGFGHPAMWTGTSTMTMHGADAVYVQKDPAWVPFKVANITGPVGTVDGDRLAGIHGVLGVRPSGAQIRSHAWMVPGDRGRVGRTTVTVPDMLSDVGAFAHLANVDRVFDSASDGTARLRVIVRGRGPQGKPFTLDMTDRFASPYDITFESAFGVYERLATLQYYSHGRPRITDVDLRTALDDRARLFELQGAHVRQGKRWVKAGGRRLVRVEGGKKLHVRLHLGSYRNLTGSKTVRFEMRMPKRRAGRTGTVAFVGGDDIYHGYRQPKSFPDLLTLLDKQVRNDGLVASLRRHRWGGRTWWSKRQHVGEVVGGRVYLRVRITR